MNHAWTKYIAVETALSVIINAALSVGITWAFFHGQDAISGMQLGRVLLDSVPQTFLVALMSFLVPSLLTLKRHRNGAVSLQSGVVTGSAGSLALRACLAAALSTILGYLLWRELLHTVFAAGLSLGTLLAVKTVYGACLAAIITPAALMTTMRTSRSLERP